MRKRYYPLIFLVLTFLVYSWRIITSNGLVVYGDFLSTLSVERFMNTMYPLWNEYGSFPTFEQLPRIVYRYPLYIVTQIFGISTYGYFKILFLGTPLLAGILMYLVSLDVVFDNREDFKCLIGAFLSAIFYMLNPWAVQRMHQQAFFLGYAMTPLVFWGIYKSLRLRRFEYYFVTALALVFSAMTPHYFVFNTVVVLLLILVEVLTKASSILDALKIIGVVYGIFLLLSSYWIVPTMLSSLKGSVSPGYAPSLDVVNVLSRNSNVLNVIRLLSAWYIRTPYKPDNPLLSSLWGIVSILVFAGILATFVLVKKEEKNGLLPIFAYTLVVVTIFLGMGTKGMFPEFYEWLVFKAPYGWVFRGSNKWIGLLAFGYSILISLLFRYIPLDRKKVLSISLVFLFMFVFYSGPNNYGFFTRVYLPADLPQEFYQMSDEVSTGGKALYFTLAHPFNIRLYDWGGVALLDTLSSPIPTFSSFSPYANPFLEFLYFQVLENRTEYFGDYLAMMGVETFIYHDRIINDFIYPNFPGAKQNENRAKGEGSLLSSLLAQKGLWLSKNVGKVYIFENGASLPRVYIPNSTVLIYDDMQTMESLNYIANITTMGILFNDLGLDKNQLEYSGYAVLNLQEPLEDFVPFYAPVLITPAKFTSEHSLKTWSRGYFNDPSHGEWHLGPLKTLGIRNWQFDYGVGFAYTNGKMQVLTGEFSVENEGQYVVLARYFENTLGGKMCIRIGDEEYTIATLSEKNRFVWKNIGKVHLERGQYKVAITNIEGFNVVNMIVLIPEEMYRSIISQIKMELQSKDILYVIEAETFSSSGSAMEDGASNGETLKTFTLMVPLNITKESDYNLGIRYRSLVPSNISIKINNLSYFSHNLGSINWSWIHLGGLHLGEGEHELLINISATVQNLVRNPSFEAGYTHWSSSSEFFKSILSRDAFDGDYSLKISTNLTTPFKWSWVRSDEIRVYPGKSYFVSFRVKYWNVNGTHVKIEGFNENSKKWESIAFVARGIRRSSNGWEKYSKVVTIPKDITRIRLVLNAGWVMDGRNGSAEVYFDDIHMYDTESMPSLDLIVLQEKAPSSATPAVITGYKEVSPTLWEVNVDSEEPFMLVLTEAYDSLWRARVYKDGKLVETISPVPVNGALNGFWINETGKLRIVLEYPPQDWFKIGMAISIMTLILGMAWIVYARKRRKEK